MKAQIPSTMDEARQRLAALEGIATATGWERAAIVYAFVDRPGSGGDRAKVKSDFCSAQDFADLGIVGLRSKNTVERYHDAWKLAIERHGASEVEPGGIVDLPEVEWPPEHKLLEREARAAADGGEGIRREAQVAGVSPDSVARMLQQPSAIAAAIRADERTAAIAEAALRDRRTEQRGKAPEPEPKPRPEPPRPSPLLWAVGLTRMVRDVDRVVSEGAAAGPLDEEAGGLVEEAASRLESAAGWLRTFARGEAINDESLHAWLGGA